MYKLKFTHRAFRKICRVSELLPHPVLLWSITYMEFEVLIKYEQEKGRVTKMKIWKMRKAVSMLLNLENFLFLVVRSYHFLLVPHRYWNWQRARKRKRDHRQETPHMAYCHSEEIPGTDSQIEGLLGCSANTVFTGNKVVIFHYLSSTLEGVTRNK